MKSTRRKSSRAARPSSREETLPEPALAAARQATVLWFLRHAEVERRYQGVFGGRIDMDLSPFGKSQARALGEYLARDSFSAFYASPMRRVQQTIAEVPPRRMPQPVVLPDLREMDFGDWTGLRWEEVAKRYGISVFDWLQAIETGSIENAETGARLRDRLSPCLRQILHAHQGGSVAIACHGGVIRVLLGLLLDLPLPKMGAIEIDYASITKVAVLPHRNELQLLNFAPWRDLP